MKILNKKVMKTFLIVTSRIVGDYTTTKVKLKNSSKVVPRKGERVTFSSETYDVISVYYDYDKEEILITVI